ncbi:hypothetical protein FRC17_010056 [Serendipita sp. 399]|nr:hypothetical protein FRC17_010056 [Serendipita sp. 399]
MTTGMWTWKTVVIIVMFYMMEKVEKVLYRLFRARFIQGEEPWDGWGRVQRGGEGKSLWNPPMSETITTDWAVRIQCKMYEPGGQNFSISSLVYLFKLPDVQVPHDPNAWLRDPHFIGMHHAMLTSPKPGEEDAIPTEHFPQQPPPKNALEPEYVVPFLRKNLYWIVLDWNGTVLDSSSLPSLEVTVAATPLIHRRGRKPEHEEPVFYPEITQGKFGGALD